MWAGERYVRNRGVWNLSRVVVHLAIFILMRLHTENKGISVSSEGISVPDGLAAY